MLEAFLTAVGVVLPVVLTLALGRLFASLTGFTEVQARGLAKLSYWVCLPVLIFRDILRAEARDLLRPGLALGVCAAILIVAVVAYRYARWRRLPPRQVGVVAQAAARSNMVFVGLPIILYQVAASANAASLEALSTQASALGAVTLASAIPLLGVVSVVVLVLPVRQDGGPPMSAARFGGLVLSNPLVVAVLAGFVALIVPGARSFFVGESIVGRTIDMVGPAAFPLALISIGATLRPAHALRRWADVLPVVVMKLILMPALGLLALWTLGVDGLALSVGVLLLSCPTAAASHPTAMELGGDDVLAGDLVAVTTVLSPFTIIGWLVVLQAVA